MNTKAALLAELNGVKQCSPAQLDRYLKRFAIQPLGVRQRPQLYPQGTAERILKGLGIIPVNTGRRRLPTMAELRRERTNSRKAAA